MITAMETKVITTMSITLMKEKRTEEFIQWCESCEKTIVKEAQKGVWAADFTYPTRKDHFITVDERNRIIKNFFEQYGYEVHLYDNYLRVGWWIR